MLLENLALFLGVICLALIGTGVMIHVICRKGAALKKIKLGLKQLELGRLDGVDGEPILAELVQGLRSKTDYCQQLASGVLSAEETKFNPEDKLGRALQSIRDRLSQIVLHIERISQGDYTQDLPLLSDQDELASMFNAMTSALWQAKKETEQNEWKKNGLAYLTLQLQRGENTDTEIAELSVQHIVKYIKAKTGSFYILDDEGFYSFRKGHMFAPVETNRLRFRIGESFVGQCAAERRMLIVSDIPPDYFQIKSSLPSTIPRQLVFLPIKHHDFVIAVMEFGFLQPIGAVQLSYLQSTESYIALALSSALARKK